jgi:hypothetical protein
LSSGSEPFSTAPVDRITERSTKFYSSRMLTQAGQTLSSATAAKRVTRATAQKALQQFLGRVEQVNNERVEELATQGHRFGNFLELTTPWRRRSC